MLFGAIPRGFVFRESGETSLDPPFSLSLSLPLPLDLLSRPSPPPIALFPSLLRELNLRLWVESAVLVEETGYLARNGLREFNLRLSRLRELHLRLWVESAVLAGSDANATAIWPEGGSLLQGI